MEITLLFVQWLMENCQLSEDNSLWSYNGEDYTNEGLYAIFLESNKAIADEQKFTLKQENAIWGFIQNFSKQQFLNPHKVWNRTEVLKQIQNEL